MAKENRNFKNCDKIIRKDERSSLEGPESALFSLLDVNVESLRQVFTDNLEEFGSDDKRFLRKKICLAGEGKKPLSLEAKPTYRYIKNCEWKISKLFSKTLKAVLEPKL